MPNIQFVKKKSGEIFAPIRKNCGKLGGKCEKTPPNQGLHFLSFVRKTNFCSLFLTSGHNFWLKRRGRLLRSKNDDKCNVDGGKKALPLCFLMSPRLAQKTFPCFHGKFCFSVENSE